jgi:hypothetical protein
LASAAELLCVWGAHYGVARSAGGLAHGGTRGHGPPPTKHERALDMYTHRMVIRIDKSKTRGGQSNGERQ